MRRQIFLGVLALALFAGDAMAAPDPCADPPVPVRNYLRAHPSLRMVRLSDLVTDDVELWTQQQAGKCPGFAVARMDATGRPAYGISARTQTTAGRSEAFSILLLPARRGLEGRVVEHWRRETYPRVVWSTTPGEAEDRLTGETVNVPHESIIFESLGASAVLYWLDGRRIRRVTTSD